MFTGLIAEVGTVGSIERGPEGAVLRVTSTLAEDAVEGDSIAVNGVCLTVTRVVAEGFEVEAMNQTLGLTSIGALIAGDRVNLEAALRAGDRLGGHIVQGHVDGIGEVVAVSPDGFARRLEVELPEPLRRYTVEHGSIGLNGASLTVAALTETGVEVSLIPETLERTTFGELVAGALVNVEVDLMARYVERLLQALDPPGGKE